MADHETDLVHVTTNGFAMFREDVFLALEILHRAAEVPVRVEKREIGAAAEARRCF